MFYIFIYFITDLNEQRIYWTDHVHGHIKSAKLDGSDVQLITSGLSWPFGIDVHNNYIYFTETEGRLYKQSKSPGSSKIQLHSDTSYMYDVKVYKGTGRYNVIELYISTLVSSFPIKVLQIY
jgi:low density lipoprotein-related protein 2